MQSLRYVLLCLCLGIIAVWMGENMFWFSPSPDLTLLGLLITVIAYSIAAGVGLSMVIATGVEGLSAAFLGGVVLGYMAEGVIVGTIYQPPLAFYWVWTPLAWHALLSFGLVLGVGRVGRTLGPLRMALIWVALGLASTYWAQYWPSELGTALPDRAALAVYLIGFGVLVVLAQVVMDRMGHLPRPPAAVLWVAPAIALAVWAINGWSDMNPARLLLPLTLALIWWTMRRLGQRAAPVSLGAPVPIWQHALILIAPLVAVLLAPVVWAQGWGTLEANWVVAGISGLTSVILLFRLIIRAIRRPLHLGTSIPG